MSQRRFDWRSSASVSARACARARRSLSVLTLARKRDSGSTICCASRRRSRRASSARRRPPSRRSARPDRSGTPRPGSGCGRPTAAPFRRSVSAARRTSVVDQFALTAAACRRRRRRRTGRPPPRPRAVRVRSPAAAPGRAPRRGRPAPALPAAVAPARPSRKPARSAARRRRRRVRPAWWRRPGPGRVALSRPIRRDSPPASTIRLATRPVHCVGYLSPTSVDGPGVAPAQQRLQRGGVGRLRLLGRAGPASGPRRRRWAG